MARNRRGDEGGHDTRTRREALAGAATLGCLSVAGCLGLSGGGGSGTTGTDAGGTTAGAPPDTTDAGTTTGPATSGTGETSTTPRTDQPTTTVSTTADEPAEILLGGRAGAWVGRAPSAIRGVRNPTIRLQVGAEYELRFENMDGRTHNLRVVGVELADAVTTDTTTREGAVAGARFTATGTMASYYCEYHSTAMSGGIEPVW